MEKEFIVKKESSVTLNITAGRIDSYRMQEETTGTVRAYADGKIGVAGALGEPDESELTRQAEEALSLGIPYVCALDGPLEREERHAAEILPEKELAPVMQALLDQIGQACPRFAISNKITLSHDFTEYRNSKGRHLLSDERALSIALLFQARGSGNLMDCFFEHTGRSFDPAAVVARCKELHDAYFNPVDVEEGEWPVVFAPVDLLVTFLRNFVGEMYASGASLVSGKMGEKLFSDKLTLSMDRNPATCPGVSFFDAEGYIAPDYRAPIIDHGVLSGMAVSKNTAAHFGLPVSGAADAAYDGVPGYGLTGLYAAPTADSLAQLVPGKAIFVGMVSGGDTTPDGHFATPVQLAYLMENGRLVGRLPELTVSGDFFSLLGENYLGAAPGGAMESPVLCAMKMKVSK